MYILTVLGLVSYKDRAGFCDTSVQTRDAIQIQIPSTQVCSQGPIAPVDIERAMICFISYTWLEFHMETMMFKIPLVNKSKLQHEWPTATRHSWSIGTESIHRVEIPRSKVLSRDLEEPLKLASTILISEHGILRSEQINIAIVEHIKRGVITSVS